MVRPEAVKCGDCETCLSPKSKRACLRPPTAASAEEPCPLPSPLTKRQCTAPEKYEPAESLRDKRQSDGKRRPDAQPSPSPSPQQPRPMTSLQLWLKKPKIDQRVQELEQQIGHIALGGAGQGNPELHEFLVTLVTQLFEAEAQAKKADKKEAQATAALLANVQAQREQTILEVCTKATIDALVGEGFNAARTLRDHVKRSADMILPSTRTRETRFGKLSLRTRSQRGSPPRLI